MANQRSGTAQAFDAFLLAGVGIGLLDLAHALGRGIVIVDGFLLSIGMQLALASLLGGVASVATNVVTRLRTFLDDTRLGTTLFHGASILFVAIGARRVVSAGPRTMFVFAALALVIALVTHQVYLKLRIRSRAGFVVGMLLATPLMLSACDAVQVLERINAASSDLWLALFAAAALSCWGIALLFAAMLSEDADWPPRRIAPIVGGIGGLLLLSPVIILPGQFPSFRFVTHTLGVCFVAFFLRLFCPKLRVPHLRKGALVFASISIVVLLTIVHPLGAAFHFVAFDSLASDPIVRMSAVLRFRTDQYLDRLRGGVEAPVPQHSRPAPTIRWSLRSKPKSVLVISLDSLRYDRTGYSGLGREGLTPAIDRLALESQRFHRAYAQGGWTSISISSLFWSRFPSDIEFVPLAEDRQLRLYLPEELEAGTGVRHVFQSPIRQPTRSLAEVLAAQGLHTIAIPNDGHTTYFDPRLGFTRGFKHVVNPRMRLRDDPSLAGAAANATDELTVNIAIESLEAIPADRPFFMWVHLFDAHSPYGDGSSTASDAYDADVHSADQQVGRLMAAVRARGLLDEMLVVLTSDHGESFGEHGAKDHGLQLYEESIRVPLLVRIPGIVPADHHGEAGLIDIAPTVLGLLGVPPEPAFQGGRLDEAERTRRPIFSETWRFRGASADRDIHLIAAVWDRRKVIYDLNKHAFEVFDLHTDPAEQHPISVESRDRGWVDWMISVLILYAEKSDDLPGRFR